MNIGDLKPGTGNATVEGEIIALEEARDVVTKFGKKLRVADAIIKDDTGEIKLSLWGDDISKVSSGDRVKVENGYVSEFKGNPQLSAGKYGKILVVEKKSG